MVGGIFGELVLSPLIDMAAPYVARLFADEIGAAARAAVSDATGDVSQSITDILQEHVDAAWARFENEGFTEAQELSLGETESTSLPKNLRHWIRGSQHKESKSQVVAARGIRTFIIAQPENGGILQRQASG